MKFSNFVYKKFVLGFVLICAVCALLAQQKEMPKADASKLIEDEIKAEMEANPNRYFDKAEVALNIYRKTLDIEKKRQCLEFIKTNPDKKCYDSSVIIYAITENDSHFKNYFEEAKEKLSKFPEVEFWRKMLNFYSSPYSGEGFAEKYIYYAENFLAVKPSSEDDEFNNSFIRKRLIYCYLLGDNMDFFIHSYNGGLPESFATSPHRDKALALLKENSEDIENIAWLIRAYRTLKDKKSEKVWIEKFFEKKDPYNDVNLNRQAAYIIAHNDEYKIPKEKIENFLKNRTQKDLGEIYNELANLYSPCLSSSQYNSKKAKEYKVKAFEYSSYPYLGDMLDLFNESQVREIFKIRSSNPSVALEFADYMAEIGKWDEAFFYYQFAYKNKLAKAGIRLFICYEEGKGVAQNSKKADEILEKIISEIKGNSYQNDSYLHLVGSKIMSLAQVTTVEKFYTALMKKPEISELARFDLMNFYRESAIEGKSQKIKLLLKDAPELNLKTFGIWAKIRNFYSADGEFQNLEKLFEITKTDFYSSKNQESYVAYIFMLAHGIGTEKDEKKAFDAIAYVDLQTCESKERFSLYAYFYEKGIGVKADAQKAMEYRKKIPSPGFVLWIFEDRYMAPKNSEFEHYYLSECEKLGNYTTLAMQYVRGQCLPKDDDKALEFYEKSIDKNTLALLEIAKIYKKNERLRDFNKYAENLKKCVELLKQRNDEPPVDLLMELGFAYFNGYGVEKNPKKAFGYFSEAAKKAPFEKNYFFSREALAFCYEHGWGVGKDKIKANKIRDEIKNFKGAQKRYFTGEYSLSIENLYDPNEFNLNPNPKRRLEWLKFFVQKYPSKENISLLYDAYTKNPQTRDWKKAFECVKLYEKFWKDTPWVNYHLGYFNLFGIENSKNESVGIEYIKRAAKANFPEALELLSYAYMQGIGVEKNKAEAEKCMMKFGEIRNAPYLKIAKTYLDKNSFKTNKNRAKYLLAEGAKSGNKDCNYFLENFEKFTNTSK